MWRTWFSSWSLHFQWKRSTGMPHLSFTSGSISQYDSSFGIISPRPESPTDVPYSSRIACFIRDAVALGAVDDAGERADARHAVAAADLDVVAAREVQRLVLVPQPPRHVEVRAVAVGVVVRHARQRGHHRRHAEADGVHQIAADLAGRVREALRMPRRLRVEQQPRRLAAARREDDRAAAHLALAAACPCRCRRPPSPCRWRR